MAHLSADLNGWSDSTCFCFEDEASYELWRATFPDGAEAGRFFRLSSLLEKYVPQATRSAPERLQMMAACLAPERREKAAQFLATIERLRGALLLQPEDVEFCFSTLPSTPKNTELKAAMLAYLDSPLAMDAAAQTWSFLEKLKSFEVSLQLGPRLVFVRALDSRYVFTELAKAFSYAEGVEEVATCDPWEIASRQPGGLARPGVLVSGPPADSLWRLGEHVRRLLDRGVEPSRIHLPFQGSPAAQAWLRYFFNHLRVPFRLLNESPREAETEAGPSLTALVASIRRDGGRELKDRLKLASQLLGDTVGRRSRMASSADWSRYFHKLVMAGLLEERELPYLEARLKTSSEEPVAPREKAGIIVSEFTLLPPLPDRVTLGYCEAALFQGERIPLLLRPGELEILGNNGFSVGSVSDHRARVDALLAVFLGSAPGRRFLFSPADPALFPRVSRHLSSARHGVPIGREPEVPSESPLLPLEPRPLSATQLEAYARCPAQYFFANRLRLRQSENIEGSFPLVFGQAAHRALETFFKEHGGDQALLADDTRVLEKLDTHFSAAVSVIAPTLETDQPFFTILGENFRRLVRKVPALERQLAELVEGGQALELEKDFSLQVGEITLRGKIDRIDQTRSGSVLILDYKTGSVDFTPNHLVEGSHFQALVYLLAADQIFKQPCAGILFYDLKRGEVRRGLLLESRLAADAKRKVTRGHALPDEKFAFFKEEGVAQLKVAAAAIARGDFSARPSPANCPNCDYAGLCRLGFGYA